MESRVKFNHREIDRRWQERWALDRTFRTLVASGPGRKRYVLDMFPYPSGAGLHVGHPEGYIASDILARYYRMKGYDVLHPMGWDAFGLPAENYALETGTHPKVTTAKNITRFRQQLQRFGFSYDWDREVNTTDPAYYKWTQWIFLQLFKAGLAYEAEAPINWCPKDKVGLANEEVVDGRCERCGTRVERRMLKQWFLRITKYADRLLEGLDKLDWPEHIKTFQRNWIGRSEGAEVVFTTENGKTIPVFTTRPDTLFGATYLVLAPEHPLVGELTTPKQKKVVEKYVKDAAKKSELERTALEKEKTGVFTGAYAENPVNGEKIPIWVADYVMVSYGTGAIMAVPAHDERDFEFAKKFKLPAIKVIQPPRIMSGSKIEPSGTSPGAWGHLGGDLESDCWIGEGTLMNSGGFDGLPSEEARKRIVDWLGEQGKAKPSVQYKLRDWVFSRQRYWGEPIPIVHCPEHGAVPVPEEELPLKLPEVEKYEPTGTGESPLAAITEWVNTKCPKCGKPAKRETNTMPQWAGSSWYFYRFTDPKNDKAFASKEALKTWMPVDFYIGGAEHAVLHLLYARFWHKALFDLGHIPREVGDEPFLKLRNQGLILGEDGEKMSKSRGNVVTPDEILDQYGADAFRCFEMFMGPLEMTKPWGTNGIVGVRRFLNRIWQVATQDFIGRSLARSLPRPSRSIHKAIKRVTAAIEESRYNTAISDLMIFFNGVDSKPDWRSKIGEGTAYDSTAFEKFLIILHPFAPHLSQELWELLGHTSLLSQEKWPTYDEKQVHGDTLIYAVQVNGTLRATITQSVKAKKESTIRAVMENDNVKRHLLAALRLANRLEPTRIIFVPGKLVNFVV